MRHGRKSSSKTFNGFKEHFAVALDSKVTREVVVRPANEPEHAAVELLADTLEQTPGLLQLDIDLGYMASPRIAPWAEPGVYIIARPWPQVGPLFTKQEFTLDFAARRVTCPGGPTVPMVPGKEAQFPAAACDVCPLRAQCTKATRGQGRSLSIREDEPFQQTLLLDSRVVDVPRAYNRTFVMLSSLKPFFFNSLQKELRFSNNAGA